jgi:hypothetical protein
MKGGIFRLVLTGISFCFSGPFLFWSWLIARLTVTLLLSAGRQLSSSTGRKENCYRPRASSSALPQPRLLSTIASEDCDDAPRMPSSIGLPANVGRHSNEHEVRAPAKSRLQKCAHRKCRMPELTGSSQLNCSTDALEQSGPVFEAYGRGWGHHAGSVALVTKRRTRQHWGAATGDLDAVRLTER